MNEKQDYCIDPRFESEMPSAYRFYEEEIDKHVDLLANLKDKDFKVLEARIDSYIKFVKFLFEGSKEYPKPSRNLLSLEDQITMVQYESLCDKYAKRDILDILLDTENMPMKEWKKYHYKIAYRVLNNWLSRRESRSQGVVGTPRRVSQS